MTIDFLEIPVDFRVPGTLVEFNPTQAQQGLARKPFNVLLIANMLATGTATALELNKVASADQARVLFGAGSILHAMVVAFRANDPFTDLWAMGITDGAGTKDVRDIAFTGTSTAAGTLYFYISGRRYVAALPTGSDDAAAATAMAAIINADGDAPVTAAETAGSLVLTNRHTSILGVDVDYRWNYNVGEEFPAGIVADTPSVTAAGTGVIVVSGQIAALGTEQFDVISTPYRDVAGLNLWQTELEARWGPTNPIDGGLFVGQPGSFATIAAIGAARNAFTETLCPVNESPSAPWIISAAWAGNASFYLAIDPARPLQTLELKGILAPSETDRFTLTERNLLLFDGISTFTVDRSGRVRIERTITTYQTNVFGAADIAYLDVNTRYTLSFLRWSTRNRMALRFPRHKLASDGARAPRGSSLVTPKILRAEFIALARDWEDAGLVENLDQFKADMIVERDESDANRANVYLPPDLVNQLRMIATQIGFRV